MEKPSAVQWVVLWLGALWSVLVLALAEDISRPLMGGGIVCALAFWQLGYRRRSKAKAPASLAYDASGSPTLTELPVAIDLNESASTPAPSTVTTHHRPVRFADGFILAASIGFALWLAVVATPEMENSAEWSGRVVGRVLAGAFLWIPGYFTHARKGDWRGFLNWCAGATLITSVLAFAGTAQGGMARPQVLFRQFKQGEITPYQFFRAVRAATSPQAFDKGMLGALEVKSRNES